MILLAYIIDLSLLFPKMVSFKAVRLFACLYAYIEKGQNLVKINVLGTFIITLDL
jgi:hypothetical protein